MPMCNISFQLLVARSAFYCSRDHCVWAGVAVALFEFFFCADGFEIDNSIDGQNAVEMIDLMLQEIREIAVIAGVELERLAFGILIAHSDLAVAFDLHEDGEEAQAGVPDDDFLFAAIDDFRIDERPGFFSRQLQEDDTLQDAE